LTAAIILWRKIMTFGDTVSAVDNGPGWVAPEIS